MQILLTLFTFITLLTFPDMSRLKMQNGEKGYGMRLTRDSQSSHTIAMHIQKWFRDKYS